MSPESSIHHCALAVKRQAQPAVGVLLRKGLLFGDRSPFLYTRAPLPGTGAEPEGPTSRGRGTVRNRRDAKAGRIGFSISLSSRRDTRYTSTMESIGRRPTLTRRRPWRSGTVAPSGPVRPAAGSGRRAVPSDSGLVVASAPACASDSAGRIATGRYRRNTVRSRLPSLVLNDLSLVLHQLV